MTYKRTRVKSPEGEQYILSEQQVDFLKYCCQDIPYRLIARWMGKSPRTIDGYRDEMFWLLQVRSRTGIVLWCLKSGFLKVPDIKLTPFKRKKKKPL